MRVKADGSGEPVRVAERQVIKKAGGTWFDWIREPVVSPERHDDGAGLRRARTRSRATSSLQFYDLADEEDRLSRSVAETAPLGPPGSRPGGPTARYLLYVQQRPRRHRAARR